MKIIFALTLAILAIGASSCARPHFAAKKNNNDDTKKREKLSCDARFRSGECLGLSWLTQPTESEAGSFVFKTFRQSLDQTALVTMAVVPTSPITVRLFMPSMGHGSSPVAVTPTAPGDYRATNVYFSMHGEWQIIFELKKNGQVIDAAILNYTY